MESDDAERLREDSRRLRALSDAILADLRALRELEQTARGLRIGSAEHVQISEEITERAHRVFRLTAQQEAVSIQTPEQDATTDDVEE